MTRISVSGGAPLVGSTRIPGAKNSVLPVLAACLLTNDPVIINDTPEITDVKNMLKIMEMLGCGYEWEGSNLTVDSSGASRWEMPEAIAKELRSSIFMLGPVVGRFKKARFTYPGGCEIGSRPIDLHLKGLSELNVKIVEEHGYIYCDGSDMRGAQIHLDYPSVGATENIMMAAVLANGTTVIHNAAREPEIIDLQHFLCSIGAAVKGAGTSTITVNGRQVMHGTSFKLVPDRIVAATIMAAVAITTGDVKLENADADHLHSVISKLRETGCKVEAGSDFIRIVSEGRPSEMKLIETQPYPGFPTDAQAQFMALASVCNGTCIIVENVFESRFKHMPELARMGADISVRDRVAVVRGVESLTGADVTAKDLRGGAALVLAGLAAKGVTNVECASIIDRGYESLETQLSGLGANIWRVDDNQN